ncbi:unnamed protein product [Amoebophrya sp. A120]|nr:unnamed protein product [Amoebophrya sp. A120]|eukprot:GSA120T00002549001.1
MRSAADAGSSTSMVARRKSRRASLSKGRKSIINLGSVVEFSRFSFDQLEIRDTDDASVFGQNNSTNTLVGKVPAHLNFYFRASDLLVERLHRFSTVLFVWNCFFTTFFLMYCPLLYDSYEAAAQNRQLQEDYVLPKPTAASWHEKDGIPTSLADLQDRREVGARSPPERVQLLPEDPNFHGPDIEESKAAAAAFATRTEGSRHTVDHSVSSRTVLTSPLAAEEHFREHSSSSRAELDVTAPARGLEVTNHDAARRESPPLLRWLLNGGPHPVSEDKAAEVRMMEALLFVDLFVFELLFVFIHLILPFRTSVILYQQGKEYVELADIHRLVWGQRELRMNAASVLGAFMWIGLLGPAASWTRFLGLFRFLRYESVQRYRHDKQCTPDGRVLSPWKNGLLSALTLALVNIFAVHIFAVIWFLALHEQDGRFAYELDTEETHVLKYYLLALRDAVLLFSASPPAVMTARQDTHLVLTQVMLKPVGALCQAVIFAEIVLIKQRMNILKSKILEQQTTINAAMSVLRLPENLRRRITMYHQFLEIQHDEQACKLLYHTSSRALVLEVKICLFAQLIEKAPLFYDLKPHGVGEIIDSFQEEVFSPGDFIIREGQKGREMYFILKGLCDVLINTGAAAAPAASTPSKGVSDDPQHLQEDKGKETEQKSSSKATSTDTSGKSPNKHNLASVVPVSGPQRLVDSTTATLLKHSFKGAPWSTNKKPDAPAQGAGKVDPAASTGTDQTANTDGDVDNARDDTSSSARSNDGALSTLAQKKTRKLTVVAQKQEGDYFGEIALVQKGAKRTAYIRAQTYCVVEKLTDEVFDDLIKNKHPVAYEKIVARIAKFHNIPHLITESRSGSKQKESRAPSKTNVSTCE